MLLGFDTNQKELWIARDAANLVALTSRDATGFPGRESVPSA
jgi:hypothetical protein